MSSPAPALLPLPRSLRTPRRSAPREVAEAPSGYDVQLELLLARVTIRGVAGVSSAAVAEYVAILQRDLAGAARLHRLNAPTLPAPACIEAALAEVVEDKRDKPGCTCGDAHCLWCGEPADVGGYVGGSSPHPADCTDPCCVPDDEDDFAAYCVDEGSHLLADPSGLYGVRGVL